MPLRTPAEGYCICGAPLGHPDDDWVCARCLMERERDDLKAQLERLRGVTAEGAAGSREWVLSVLTDGSVMFGEQPMVPDVRETITVVPKPKVSTSSWRDSLARHLYERASAWRQDTETRHMAWPRWFALDRDFKVPFLGAADAILAFWADQKKHEGPYPDEEDDTSGRESKDRVLGVHRDQLPEGLQPEGFRCRIDPSTGIQSLHGPVVPAPGWPCQTESKEELPPRLVATLYRLLRDYIQPGDLEQVMLDVHPVDDVAYTNPHLEALARAHASYLLDKIN